ILRAFGKARQRALFPRSFHVVSLQLVTVESNSSTVYGADPDPSPRIFEERHDRPFQDATRRRFGLTLRYRLLEATQSIPGTGPETLVTVDEQRLGSIGDVLLRSGPDDRLDRGSFQTHDTLSVGAQDDSVAVVCGHR